MNLPPLLAILFLALITLQANSETIQFKSADGLLITAETYTPHPSTTPIIVLFHQAGFSRGEYTEIAPKLNQLGFNALAIDQRSGKSALGITNQTAQRALTAGLTTRYTDALPDMIASLHYAQNTYPEAPIIAWGSSYSAGLVLKIAGDQAALLHAVLAFSPSEYFARLGKPADWVTQSAQHIKAPVFITSARNEGPNWAGINAVIPPQLQHTFLPKTAGKHGSRALWAKQADHPEYWLAVSQFLNTLFPDLAQ